MMWSTMACSSSWVRPPTAPFCPMPCLQTFCCVGRRQVTSTLQLSHLPASSSVANQHNHYLPSTLSAKISNYFVNLDPLRTEHFSGKTVGILIFFMGHQFFLVSLRSTHERQSFFVVEDHFNISRQSHDGFTLANRPYQCTDPFVRLP